MAKRAGLTTLLGRIRRRLRWQAALEGAVAGGAIAGLAMAAGATISRARGAVAVAHLPALLLAGLAAGVLAGAALRGSRRIPLERCARRVDAALDGQDRVLSALELEHAAPSPFSRALVADAIQRMTVLAPRVVAPARRPRGLPAFGVAALALVFAALAPGRSRAAHPVAVAVPVPLRAPLPASALEVEREQVRAAAAEAARLGDERLAALAADFDRALRRISRGSMADGEALDLLRALEARAAEAAQAAERDRRAAEGAVRALEGQAATRAAGAALARAADGDESQASAALATSAAEQPAATGRALAAAAQSLAGASSGAGEAGKDAPNGPRHLNRNDSPAAPSTGDATTAARNAEERRLEHLSRDLDQTAAACQNGGPDCRAGAADRGRELAQLGRRGASRDFLQQLSRTAGQLRSRLGRGEVGGESAQAERGFARAARGDSGRDSPSNDGRDGAESKSAAGVAPGAGDQDDAPAGEGGDETQAQAALLAAGENAPGAGAAGLGNGIGRQAGGAPLGARASELAPAHGSDAAVRVANGAGPNRAEVIGSAAGRGFASRGYARMFTDYAAAVEDALGAADVPAGKRYLVRRYFDLIRPRTETARRAP